MTNFNQPDDEMAYLRQEVEQLRSVVKWQKLTIAERDNEISRLTCLLESVQKS